MEYLEDLEALVKRYFNEAHKIYKFVDADGEPLRLNFHFESRLDYLNKYLSFYKNLANLSEVIEYACTARFSLEEAGEVYEITHPHQQYFIARDEKPRGVEATIMRQVASNVQGKIENLEQARTFDDIIYVLVQSKVNGFGDLAIYDSSVRIANYLDIMPDKVFLHAGVKEGAVNLEAKGLIPRGSSSQATIDMDDMPKPLQQLHPVQVENFLCSFKTELKNLEK